MYTNPNNFKDHKVLPFLLFEIGPHLRCYPLSITGSAWQKQSNNLLVFEPIDSQVYCLHWIPHLRILFEFQPWWFGQTCQVCISAQMIIDDVTDNWSIRMNSVVYKVILYIQSNAAKLIRWCFIIQMDKNPKQTVKSNPRDGIWKKLRAKLMTHRHLRDSTKLPGNLILLCLAVWICS